MVVPGAPDGILHELIQQLVGAFEPSGARHVGVHGNGGKVFRAEGHTGFHLDVLEAEDGKGGLIVILPFAAGIDHLLQGCGDLFIGALDILLGKLAILVQQFAEAQEDPLPLSCLKGEFCIARNVLPKIQHGFPGGCGNNRGFQTLMLLYRDIVGGSGDNLVGGQLCLSLK